LGSDRNFNSGILNGEGMEERNETDLRAGVDTDPAPKRFAAERGVCEFTKDPEFLYQYYEMRQRVFTSVWGLKHFCGGEEEHDIDGHILVARLNNLVIGGCRLCISTPKQPRLLPMEGNDFKLPQVVQELEIPKVSYGEFSRLAVLPEYRSTDLLDRMYRHMNRLIVERGLKYVFAIAPRRQAISTRWMLRPFHLRYSIREDIHVPEREEYEGIRMTFAVMSNFTPLDNPL
jgi:hypothetical protein